MGTTPSLILIFLCVFPVKGLERSFTIDYAGDTFLKDGKAFRYVSGSIHYNRVPQVHWRDRLLKMHAAGLNAITTYVPWNFHELKPGHYDFSKNLDLVGFIKMAQSLGLLVILRPGPYTDAGWDFGGLPGWLVAHTVNMTVRTMDPVYIKAVDKWLDILLPKVKLLLYHNGGPIITVQVENEYGSYFACDFDYLRYLRQKFRFHLGNKVVLFTTDGGADFYLKCGTLEGLYSTIDFGFITNATTAFAPQRKWEPHGPLVCSEFYTGAQDYWGYPFKHYDWQIVVKSLSIVLDYNNASVSMYMFTGGTTFGYLNGILINPLRALVTSYDFDAPLTEAGDTTEKYFQLRALISQHTHPGPQPVPPNTTKHAYGSVYMSLIYTLQDGLQRLSPAGPVKTTYPIYMENVGQFYGYILYQHTAVKSYNSGTLVITGIRDRGYVMVNSTAVGILLCDNMTSINISIKAGEVLDILVENMGKVFYEPGLDPNQKGIISNVTLNNQVLRGWQIFPLSLENAVPLDWNKILKKERVKLPSIGNSSLLSVPTLYGGTFQLPNNPVHPLDTFIDVKLWRKGQLFINGINLGRYWPAVGPQITLYVPKSVLKPYPSENNVVLFELERSPCDKDCVVNFVDKPDLGKPNELKRV